jgi:hypothetical protein
MAGGQTVTGPPIKPQKRPHCDDSRPAGVFLVSADVVADRADCDVISRSSRGSQSASLSVDEIGTTLVVTDDRIAHCPTRGWVYKDFGRRLGG